MNARADVERAIGPMGLWLEVKNNGHHWQFRRGKKLVAQWWPSAAKFVYGTSFDDGVHTHGWDQVVRLLERMA